MHACGREQVRAQVHAGGEGVVRQAQPNRNHLRHCADCRQHPAAPPVHDLWPLREGCMHPIQTPQCQGAAQCLGRASFIPQVAAHAAWHLSILQQAGGAAHAEVCAPAGTTGSALSSANCVRAGRGPRRQKKRHLGSAPCGRAARCSGGCARMLARQSGSTTQRGTSTPSGVAPTCTARTVWSVLWPTSSMHQSPQQRTALVIHDTLYTMTAWACGSHGTLACK
jgi:hypothetical protein